MKLILFDVGGVLVDYAGYPKLREWTRNRLSKKQLWQWWMTSKAVHDYETGAIGSDKFYQDMVAELKLPLSPKAFGQEISTWFRGALPGAGEVLSALTDRYQLVTLSNTNPVFWGAFMGSGLAQYFAQHFPSHRTGVMKPDPQAYKNVLQATGVAADSMLFLDDSQANIDAARQQGIHAEKAVGIVGVKEALYSAHIDLTQTSP